jgi:NADH pyrophosphatase family protein
VKYWFIFYKDNIILKKEGNTYDIPFAEKSPIPTYSWTHIMDITPTGNGYKVKAFSINTAIINDSQYEMCKLRESFYKLSKELYIKAGKCYELLYWDQNTAFCGICGGIMKMNTNISKRCTNCGKEFWPQLSTAVIVLVQRGEEVLLVHSRNFKTNFYGLIAGFVETGETLEEAAHREVLEETGIKIKNLRYFSSQPWPYPCGLMVGFFAEYDSGRLHLQKSELSKGHWFSKNNLPTIPEPLSIARIMIDNWLKNKKENKKQN